MTHKPCLAALLVLAPSAYAQDALRDPLQPPAAARAAASAPDTAASAVAEGGPWRPRYLIASGGRRWLVQDGRRHGVGDRLGQARIERIDDDAVWLRDAAGLTRVPLFAGAAKRPSSVPVPGQTLAARPLRQERPTP